VNGLGEVATVDGPVLLAANHTSHLDTPALLKALPRERRDRVAVAAASDYFFANPWLGSVVALAFNAFPFERTSCSQVRAALDRCRSLLDEGWSVLLYPEGTRSVTGRIAPFKPGLGLLAVEMRVPVVPVYLDGPFGILPKGRCLPRRGAISVRFGKPLNFSSGDRFRDAAHAIEDAVRSLAAAPCDEDAGVQKGAAICQGRPLEEYADERHGEERVI
jgi:long-chain acyl-CoA synthetase